MRSFLKFMLCSLIVCCFVDYVYAITVTGTNPPYVTGSGSPYTEINQALSDAYDDAIIQANNDLQKFDEQSELAKGFANANTYAAQAGTFQGYQDYSLFAVTTGIMVAAQLPSSNKDYYDDLDEKIKDDGDLYAGVSAGLSIINFGLNAGFLYPGLYLNAKFGYFSNDSLVDNLSTKSTLVGIGANYTYIQTASFLAGFVKWRGISFGTGFLYNHNNTDFKIEIDEITYNETAGLPIGIDSVDVVLDPSIKLGIKSNSYTIPFDVTTSVQLLWFLNFTLGVGIDFNFGTTDIEITSDGSVGGQVNSATSYPVNPGTFRIDGSTKNQKPSWIRQRIMTGIGFNILAVKIDVPVIIYPFDSAIAVGVTAGVVW